jgi:hypothetical protein
MEPLTSTTSIALEIQLSIGPVFLLTAIAGMLTVLTGRLTRAVDRASAMLSAQISDEEPSGISNKRDSFAVLNRIWLIEWAIRLNVSSALVICLVVVALFTGDYVEPDLSPAIAGLFISAMVLLIVGLLFFLQEVRLAAQQTRTDIEAIIVVKSN